MFKIPFIRNEGGWHKVNCFLEFIPLSAIRLVRKRAQNYLKETWNIINVYDIYFLSEDIICNIPLSEGQLEIRHLWIILTTKKITLTEKDFKKLIKLKESKQRYNGVQKRSLLGIALIESLIDKKKLIPLLKTIPGFEKCSPEKKKVILAAA